jgi:competence protein ComFC
MNYLNAFLDLFLPSKCYICDKFCETEVCNTCLAKISFQFYMNKKIKNIEDVYSLCLYEDVIKKLLKLIKFNSMQKIAEQMGALLNKSVTTLPFSNIDYWVPVPIHKKKLKKRGFNQVDLLFNELLLRHKVNLTDLAERTKNTKALHGLGPEERQKEIKGVFDLRNNINIRNKNICILDDILTTGATVSELAGLLKEKGANKIYVLTVCYGK